MGSIDGQAVWSSSLCSGLPEAKVSFGFKMSNLQNDWVFRSHNCFI